MDKIRIVYICHFSNGEIRSHLHLQTFWLGNLLRIMLRKPKLHFGDLAYWNVDFIKAFGNIPDFECHVISHHLGMKKKKQSFIEEGIHYVFLQEKENLHQKIWKTLTRSKNKEDILDHARNINKVIKEINPDIVVLCGAENPIYSGGALLVQDKPVFVILQTLLNDPMRIQAGIGSETRRQLENSVLRHADYYALFNLNEANYVRSVNPRSQCLRLMFPSSPILLPKSSNKDYDFVFFASGLSKYKGIEDALKAFAFVHKRHTEASFYVIGSCEDTYQAELLQIIDECEITNSVFFHGPFPTKQDVLTEVSRAKVAVLPGITAPLNSTVRETMFLGLPTIVYDNTVIQQINKNMDCLISAKKEDVEDLGMKMLYAYENTDVVSKFGENAKVYAYNTFSSEAISNILERDIHAIMDHYYYHKPISKDLLLS